MFQIHAKVFNASIISDKESSIVKSIYNSLFVSAKQQLTVLHNEFQFLRH